MVLISEFICTFASMVFCSKNDKFYDFFLKVLLLRTPRTSWNFVRIIYGLVVVKIIDTMVISRANSPGIKVLCIGCGFNTGRDPLLEVEIVRGHDNNFPFDKIPVMYWSHATYSFIFKCQAALSYFTLFDFNAVLYQLNPEQCLVSTGRSDSCAVLMVQWV